MPNSAGLIFSEIVKTKFCVSRSKTRILWTFAIIMIFYVKNFKPGIRSKDKISKSSAHKKQGIYAHLFVRFRENFLIFGAERMLRYSFLCGIYRQMVINTRWSLRLNLMTIWSTNPNPIQSPNITLFQFKEIKMPGYILESIDWHTLPITCIWKKTI